MLKLATWKNSGPSYHFNPRGIADLCQSLFATTKPSYADIVALLNSLLTYEKKILVWGASRRHADMAHATNVALTASVIAVLDVA